MNLFSFPFILYLTEVIYYYKSYLALFTIIMEHLILYQKFLNERMRTIYIFAQFMNFNFEALSFTQSALFCLKILLSISISKVFLICSNTSLLTDFFGDNFSKEIAKLFSGSARISAMSQACLLSITQPFSQFHLFICHDNLVPRANFKKQP